MRSAPHRGELAENAKVDSSGSKLIQHWRRKYSDGLRLSHGTSHEKTSAWWSRRSSQGTIHPPLASRNTSLRSGKRSHAPPASRQAIDVIRSTGLEMA